MNRSSFVAILTIMLFTAPLISAQDSYDARIDQLADQVDKNVIAWRHQMHQNPELPMREFETAKLVADHMRSLGFDDVRTEVGKTGVVGVLKGGKGQYANHSPYFYVNDEVLKTGVRIYSNVVFDFLSGEL